MPGSTPVVAVVTVAALLLTACDDDGADAPQTTPAPSTAAEALTDGTAGVVTTPVASGDPELTFGYLAPGVGLLNALAIGQERGLTLALEEINAAGGVLGAPVAVVSAEESADRPIDAVLDDLADQGADVIVGPVGSASSAAIGPLLGERALLACSASATASSLTDAAERTDDADDSDDADDAGDVAFVRTALRDDHFARLVADELTTVDEDVAAPTSALILGRDDVYGNELTAALSADLTARGVDVSTIAYPPRRVTFPEESQAVAAANPDLVVLAAFTEAPTLIAQIAAGGYPVDRIVGLDGLLVPRLAEQTFPQDPTLADGLRVIGTTGDRALMARLEAVPASEDQVSYGPQMYDCAITLALAAVSAGSVEPAVIGEQLGGITADGRTCSTFAHCVQLLAAGEDIDYDGTTGRIAFDGAGDISTARLTTASVIEGRLQPVAARDIDLVAEREAERFASAVFVAQLQQVLKVLGFYEGDVTGVYDDATTDAVAALQRQLDLPETGEYDDATDAALRERLGRGAAALRSSIEQLQEALTELGFYSGPIDGRYSAETVAAIKAFQRDLGVPETGVIDVATLRAIYARGQATGTGAPTTPAPDATTTTAIDVPAPTASLPPAPATTTTAAPPPPPQPSPTPPPPDTPPPEPSPTSPTDTTAPPGEENLYAVLAADPDFSTLVAVLRTAGYGTDLSQPGPLTVFAPTNDAFDGLDSGELDELRNDAGAADALLRDLAIEGSSPSSDLTSGDVQTFGGAAVEVVVDGDTITFGGATIVRPDMTAVNGIAHGIDALPEAVE